ncbi:hypothetical protein E2C01_077104 [Portunus trituberculatus]|uniref:Uncharacterized protein n=1 Tax=Portunus trituberculatus TaxID=210409 RepID=A0A5B7IKW0_PORTR|nr:hypothetical protein [Portunus trituberculatus]
MARSSAPSHQRYELPSSAPRRDSQ